MAEVDNVTAVADNCSPSADKNLPHCCYYYNDGNCSSGNEQSCMPCDDMMAMLKLSLVEFPL